MTATPRPRIRLSPSVFVVPTLISDGKRRLPRRRQLHVGGEIDRLALRLDVDGDLRAGDGAGDRVRRRLRAEDVFLGLLADLLSPAVPGGLRRHARPIQLEERIGQLGDLRETGRVRRCADDAVRAFIFDAGLAGARAAAGTGRARRAGRSCGSCCSCGSARSAPTGCAAHASGRRASPTAAGPRRPARRSGVADVAGVAGAAAGSGGRTARPRRRTGRSCRRATRSRTAARSCARGARAGTAAGSRGRAARPEPPPAPALLPPVAVSPVVESGDTQPIAAPTHTHSRKTGPAFIGLIRAPIPACRPS